MKADIAIMTCPREPAYVAELLSSMFRSSQNQRMDDVRVRVVVDSENAAHLGAFADDKRLTVEALATPPEEPVGHPHRILRTFRRCLNGANGTVPFVLMQDDAVVASLWLDAALAGHDMLANAKARPFVLALWHGFAYHRHAESTMLMAPEYFAGNVGLLFPTDVLARLREFVEQRSDDLSEPDDMLLKRFLMTCGVRIYNLNPAVVKHVGRKSTHLTYDITVQTPSFKDT